MLTIIPRSAHKDIIIPSEIYVSTCVADAHTEDGHAFEIYAGLSRSLADQLVAYSCDLSDTALQENTNDYKRFCEGDFAETFADKKRLYFSLVEKDTGALASIFWLSPRALPEAQYSVTLPETQLWDTVSFRTYGPYRGVGVTKAFNAYVFDYIDTKRSERPLWLVVSEDNAPGMKLYHKLGFHEVGRIAEVQKIVMWRSSVLV